MEDIKAGTVTPDIEGPYGKGWRARQEPLTKDHSATLGGWIITAPNSHPMWPWVVVTMIHLRDIEGVPKALVYREGATHEISVYALNPDYYPPSLTQPLRILTPPNYVGQMVYASDEEAKSALDTVANDIVQGYLNPDEDGRGAWRDRFGSHCFKKG